MCRELMEALLTSEAATRNDYERMPGERHGGVHKKKVVTLFGQVGPIPRAYYHSKGDGDGGAGRYPWDERMGLLGKHTPAVVSEVLRLAAIHGYEEAAQEFENAHGFRISPDTMRDIVIGDAATAAEFNLTCGHVEQEQRETLAYVLGDGTGISMFRRYLEGVKGKDGKEAKTREVKVAAFFTGSMKKGKPCRDEDSTTYIATTERWEESGRMSRRAYSVSLPQAGQYEAPGLQARPHTSNPPAQVLTAGVPQMRQKRALSENSSFPHRGHLSTRPVSSAGTAGNGTGRIPEYTF